MWRLTFPFFTIKLITTLSFTFLQAAIFRFTVHKLVAVNVVLTLAALALGMAWRLMPSANQPTTNSLGISIPAVPSFQPLYLTATTAEIETMLQKYEYSALQQPFIPQFRYVNLAILAFAARQYELADQFVKLARSIDPNQDFFSD